MKPVMYHYVRPAADGLPHFPYLSLADFERQLDDFADSYGFVGRGDFLRWVGGSPAPRGVLLTFDDGLRDHAEFVLPALQARGLFGLFYVSSGPAMTGQILDVHKVHLALGRVGAPPHSPGSSPMRRTVWQATGKAKTPSHPTRIRHPMRPPNS